MSNTEGTMNASQQSGATGNQRKRKWTTQMMKTWVATDPSRTAPVIQHRDPKAAARAEKKKKRKIEEEFAARTSYGYRTSQPPPPSADEHNSDLTYDPERYFSDPYRCAYARAQDRRAMLPPPEAYGVVNNPTSSWTAGANSHMFDTLIPFEREKTTTWEWDSSTRDHELESARWSSPDGSEREEPQYLSPGEDAVEFPDVDGHIHLGASANDEHANKTMTFHEARVGDAGEILGINAEDSPECIRVPTNGAVGPPDEFPTTRMDVDEVGAEAPVNESESGHSSDACRPCGNAPERIGHCADGMRQEDGEVQTAAADLVPADLAEITAASRTAYESNDDESRQESRVSIEDSLQASAVQEPGDVQPDADSSANEGRKAEAQAHTKRKTNQLPHRWRDAEEVAEHEDEDETRNDASCGETIPQNTKDFNSGWRRYGPQGEDICDYVPHFDDAPKIRWPTGVLTLAPYIPTGDQRKGMKNKLKWDQTYTNTVARRFKSSRDRPDLCVHAMFTTVEDATRLIRECMAKGIPLVFDDYPDSLRWAYPARTVDEDPFMVPMRWSDDDVHGVVGACLDTPRDFQDAAVRESNELAPYITATLHDFHTWLKEPGVVRCILDLTCGFPQSDELTNRIADNVVQSVSQTYGNKYSGHFTIAADMMKTQDWFLLHTSGFLTFGHIDASGMATSAQIRGAGMKEWIIYKATKVPTPKPTDTRRAREKAMDALVTRIYELIEAASDERLDPKKRKSKDWEVDGCVIELRPGMKYFQPSGTVHGAYTPIPTAAAGKHFFTYDDLHRVEVSRRIQFKYPETTNHNHNCGVQLMLISMAAATPMKAKAVFYRKPSIAMALMLIRPYDYIRNPRDGEGEGDENAEMNDDDGELQMTERLRSERWAKTGNAFDRLAYTVALRILNACKVKYPGDKKRKWPGREYIFEGKSWEDPGPTIDMRAVTYDLLRTHVDNLPPGNGDGDSSDSDLTDLEDL